jgi:hypothetical protein
MLRDEYAHRDHGSEAAHGDVKEEGGREVQGHQDQERGDDRRDLWRSAVHHQATLISPAPWVGRTVALGTHL